MKNFIQTGPKFSNMYTSEPLLGALLDWKLPAHWRSKVDEDLRQLGDLAAGPMVEMAKQAESQPPEHVPYSPWGERVDEICVSEGWKEFHRISARQGLIALGYERQQGEYSRLYQFAKLFLFHPTSAVYTCPLAMADGAARVLEKYGSSKDMKEAFAHLTSRDPDRFWVSGQWMTEKTGGSDVTNTSTVATPNGEAYTLKGTKWFSSATTGDMALALVRIEGDEEGSRGLTLFYVPMRRSDGSLNGIKVRRLKDKLGTRALPTAELDLEESHAEIVGERGAGVKTVATMLNITRLYNSITSVADIHYGYMLAKDYAQKREAFQKPLIQHELHAQSLADMRLKATSHLALTMHLAHLMGREETGAATEAEVQILRLLTPVLKLSSAKDAIRNATEVVESIGGAGYVEDTGIPVLLRNSQVYPIWEGTTHVLSLDVLRVLAKNPQAFETFCEDVMQRLDTTKEASLKGHAMSVHKALRELQAFAKKLSEAESSPPQARSFAVTLGRVFTASLMVEWVDHVGGSQAWLKDALELYIDQGLTRDLQWYSEDKQSTIQRFASSNRQ